MAALGKERHAEVVAAVLVVVSLVLMILPEGTQQSFARRANHVLLLPMAAVRSTFSGYLRLREENVRLRQELQQARLELSRESVLHSQNRELRELLGFSEGQPVRLVPARVVDRDFATLPTSFVLDVGEEDGVEEGLPVVSADGLVGKTTDVGPASSRVILHSHPDFSASALLVGGDHLEYGIVRPTPRGGLRLLLPLRSKSEAGDPVVTSGYGGTFPRGIPIGWISRARDEDRLGLQRIDRVDPVVDLGTTTAVFVLNRRVETTTSAGDVLRLFWPGYAYPPMAGERLGGGSDTADAAPLDSMAGALRDR